MSEKQSAWRFWPGNPQSVSSSLVISHDAGVRIEGKNWFQAREEYRKLRHTDPSAWEQLPDT